MGTRKSVSRGPLRFRKAVSSVKKAERQLKKIYHRTGDTYKDPGGRIVRKHRKAVKNLHTARRRCGWRAIDDDD